MPRKLTKKQKREINNAVKSHWKIILVLILLVAVFIMFNVFNYEPGTKQISYSELVQAINTGKVEEMTISDRVVEITLKQSGESAPGVSNGSRGVNIAFVVPSG